MISIDTEKLSFCNDQNKVYASDLFGPKGFCVIKNFLSPEEVSILKERYRTEKEFHQLEAENYHKFSVRYFYKNKTQRQDQDVMSIVNKTYRVRNEIALQPNSDQFLLAYCCRYSLEPEQMEKLIDHQMGHSFVRVAKYKAGEGQLPHYDNPSELQCIVPLTGKGTDYYEGGLFLDAGDHLSEVDVDALVKPGDLVILNSYRKKHWVKPVKCKEGQMGRLHIFIPIIPEYIFARGKGYYYFRDQPFKLFFSLPTSVLDKIRYYCRHLWALLLKKSKPIDEGFKN